MKTEEITELEVAQMLGEQVFEGEPLSCPVCQQWRGPFDSKQPMCSVADMREFLFCPHCDLTVKMEATFR